MDVCWERSRLPGDGGDGGGVLGSSARAGPVGHTGMCLFGTGIDEQVVEEEEGPMDSREGGGVIDDSER